MKVSSNSTSRSGFEKGCRAYAEPTPHLRGETNRQQASLVIGLGEVGGGGAVGLAECCAGVMIQRNVDRKTLLAMGYYECTQLILLH